MPALRILHVLTRLENKKLSPDRAAHLIRRIKIREINRQQRQMRRLFSCLTVRIHRDNRPGLFIKIPLGFVNLVIALATCSQKVKGQMAQAGISRRDLRALICLLKRRDARFSVLVESAKGEKVQVYN